MSASDSDGATTDIASFFRAPDLYACSCARMYGSVWAAMFGASGTFESRSRPWHAWHISALARPVFTSPAFAVAAAANKNTDRNRQDASWKIFGRTAITIDGAGTTGSMMAPIGRAISRVRSLLAVVPDAIERSDQIDRKSTRLNSSHQII